jgi:hypothetical protein
MARNGGFRFSTVTGRVQSSTVIGIQAHFGDSDQKITMQVLQVNKHQEISTFMLGYQGPLYEDLNNIHSENKKKVYRTIAIYEE